MLRFAPFPSFLELSKSLESGKKVRAEVLENFLNFWKSMILDQSTCLWSLGSSSESDHRGISTDLLRIAESRDISRKSWISTPKSENINFSRLAYMFSYSWKKIFFLLFFVHNPLSGRYSTSSEAMGSAKNHRKSLKIYDFDQIPGFHDIWLSEHYGITAPAYRIVECASEMDFSQVFGKVWKNIFDPSDRWVVDTH